MLLMCVVGYDSFEQFRTLASCIKKYLKLAIISVKVNQQNRKLILVISVF